MIGDLKRVSQAVVVGTLTVSISHGDNIAPKPVSAVPITTSPINIRNTPGTNRIPLKAFDSLSTSPETKSKYNQ